MVISRLFRVVIAIGSAAVLVASARLGATENVGRQESHLEAPKSPDPLSSAGTVSRGHPRLIVGPEELAATVALYRKDPALFSKYLPAPSDARLKGLPAEFKADDCDATLAKSSFLALVATAYRITGDSAYRTFLLKWTHALQAFEPIGIRAIGEKNNDLAAGGLLLNLALTYDLTVGVIDPDFSAALKRALTLQCLKSSRDLQTIGNLPFEQNHVYIPACGIGIATLVLDDKEDAIAQAANYANDLVGKCLSAISHDGWYFEGISYWNFAASWLSVYAEARLLATGDNLFSAPFFRQAGLYLAHMILPDHRFAFDFGDWGPRVNPGGKSFQTGYDRPWHSVQTRLAPLAPSIISRRVNDPLFGLILSRNALQADRFPPLDAAVSALGLGLPPTNLGSTSLAAPFHFFPDMGVVHWRDSWSDPNGTAIAFKSGPPAGHNFTKLLQGNSQWQPSLGHAHPDAGSFILFSRGAFLANDTGYTGKKETADHNSILVDGIGQNRGGTPWSTFADQPYNRLDGIRMRDVWLHSTVVAGTADMANAYDPSLGLKRARRQLLMVAGRYLLVVDELSGDSEHQYEWRLHSDTEARPLRDNNFLVVNRGAQLLLANLGPVTSAEVHPTIVETELFDPKISRSQQRGFHLKLKSPYRKRGQFRVAMSIESSSEDPAQFRAENRSDGGVMIADGQGTCHLWLSPAAPLNGRYGYVLMDKEGRVRGAGVCGRQLLTDAVTIKLTKPGSASLKNDQGSWVVEYSGLTPEDIHIQFGGGPLSAADRNSLKWIKHD